MDGWQLVQPGMFLPRFLRVVCRDCGRAALWGRGSRVHPLSLPFNLDNLRESPVQSIGMTGSPGWGISGGYTLDVTGSPVNHGVCNVQV